MAAVAVVMVVAAGGRDVGGQVAFCDVHGRHVLVFGGPGQREVAAWGLFFWVGSGVFSRCMGGTCIGEVDQLKVLQRMAFLSWSSPLQHTPHPQNKPRQRTCALSGQPFSTTPPPPLTTPYKPTHKTGSPGVAWYDAA